MFKHLRHVLGNKPRATNRRSGVRQRARSIPLFVEPLEDRTVLSSFAVVSESGSANYSYSATYVIPPLQFTETGHDSAPFGSTFNFNHFAASGAGGVAGQLATPIGYHLSGDLQMAASSLDTSITGGASASATVSLRIDPGAGENIGDPVTVTRSEIISTDNGGTATAVPPITDHGGAFDEIHATIGSTITIAITLSAVPSNPQSFAHIALDCTLPLSSSGGLTVTTPDSQSTSGPQFGPYLPGVSLSVPFSVSANDPSNQIASVKWSVNGGTTKIASPAANHTWTFNVPNVGQYSVDPSLVVTAYDSNGNQVGTRFDGSLHLTPLPLTFQLTAGNNTAVEDLRFIHSVPANETFTGTIGNLPAYYDNLLNVNLGIAPWKGAQFQGSTFTLPTDAGQLPIGNTPVSVLAGTVDLSRFGAAAHNVDEIATPSWFTNAAASFSSSEGSDGTYHFDNARVSAITFQRPAPHTGLDWLDAHLANLTTDVDLSAFINIVAPLNVNAPVTFDGQRIRTKAVVLGQTVVPETTYASSAVTIGGTLDTQTLDPNGLSIALNPVTYNATFLKQSFTIPVTTHVPGLSVTVKLEVNFTGALTFEGGVALTTEGGHVILDPNGTFLELTASPTLAIDASLTVSFIGFSVTGSAFGDATLDVTAGVEFSGTPLAPQVASTNLDVTLSGHYGWSVFTRVGKDQTPLGQDTEPFGPFELL
jgi:hypothetical protein